MEELLKKYDIITRNYGICYKKAIKLFYLKNNIIYDKIIIGDNMNDSDKKVDELLKKIDDVQLVSEKEFKNMDFYELAYYMQTLNQIDELADEGGVNNE